MKKILIGEVQIPLDEYASQGNAVLGIRDSGKSYTSMVIAEQLIDAGIPIIAIDPIGVWRFLRVPGKGKGYPVVVAGGDHGDFKLSPENAQEIVRAAMKNGVSLIIDLFSMELSKADWKRIVEITVRTMLHENRQYGLRHIFIEEAAEFCPQRVGPDQGRVYAEIEKLARMGGNSMLGYTMINQRGEEVNKAVLELCDCILLHRQKGRNSMTALGKWLDVGETLGKKEIIKSLPVLPQGQCWVWSAGSSAPILAKVQAKNSFHPNRRTMPGAVIAKAEAKHVDVAKFVADMRVALTIKEKEVPAGKIVDNQMQTIKSMEKTINDLTQQLKRADQVVIDTSAAMQKLVGIINQINKLSSTSNYDIQVSLKSPFIGSLMTEDYKKLLEEPLKKANHQIKNDIKQHYSIFHEAAPISKEAYKSIGNKNNLPKAEKMILTALAQYPQGRTKTQIAVLCGYSSRGGGFNNALGALRGKGYIKGSTDLLQPTTGGLMALGEFEPLPIGRALLNHWLTQLGKAEKSILLELTAYKNQSYSKEALAQNCGYEPNGGGFNNALGKLRTLELITGRGEIRASEFLFD